MKLLIALVVAAFSMGAFASEAGVNSLPKNSAGLPVYGEGSDSIRVGVVGKGRGLVLCDGDVFAEEDSNGDKEGYKAFVRSEPTTGYFGWTRYTRLFASEAGSKSCARNKTVLMCSFENTLEFCEANVQVTRL